MKMYLDTFDLNEFGKDKLKTDEKISIDDFHGCLVRTIQFANYVEFLDPRGNRKFLIKDRNFPFSGCYLDEIGLSNG